MPNFVRLAFGAFSSVSRFLRHIAPSAAPFATEILTCAVQSELVGSPRLFLAGVFVVG